MYSGAALYSLSKPGTWMHNRSALILNCVLQVKLPSNVGGELKYVKEVGRHERVPYIKYTTPFTLTHRDHLIYEDVDREHKWTDGQGNNHTGVRFRIREPWLKSVEVDRGTDTGTLTGLQRSTTYRVGFWVTDGSNFNILYKVLRTRGISSQVHFIP